MSELRKIVKTETELLNEGYGKSQWGGVGRFERNVGNVLALFSSF